MVKTVKQKLSSYKQEFFLIFILLTAFLAAIPLVTYVYFAKDLTTKERIMNKNSTGLILTDRTGKPFFTFYQPKHKTTVPLREIPEVVRLAAVAAEDREFYSHPGFSVKGMVRALILDIQKQDVAYGGSTITQQLVKNALLTSRRSVLRKYQELVLAQELERRFSKDEILEMYLNSVYFGEGAFGIAEAAQTYFSKKPQDLTLDEATLLIGILPAPSEYSPLNGNLDKAEQRQQFVLQQMVEEGYITNEQKEKIVQTEIALNPQKDQYNTVAPHFALMVRDELISQYGEERISRSGFRVRTTLDLQKQQYAEQVVKTQVENFAANNVTNGAAVVMDPKTGEVLALVGSNSWYNDTNGKINMATSPRQPGSSFKPIVYALGFEEGTITPATILKDTPTTFPVDYRPQNYDRRFRGSVTVRRSLANSLNVPSVAVMEKIGVERVLSTASLFGITTLKDSSQYGLSLVLGTGEVPLLQMVTAYSVFANNGVRYEPTTILEVHDKIGERLYIYEPKQTAVLDPSSAFFISSILSDNRARADVFGDTLTLSRPAAVKTGTTENYRDAWTIGYTPSLVVGAWVGNNDNKPMDQVAGSLGAAPIWKQLMEQYVAQTPIEQFDPPAGVYARTVCLFSGGTTPSAIAITEYFADGNRQSESCPTPTPAPVTQKNESESPPPGIEKQEERKQPDEKPEKKEKED